MDNLTTAALLAALGVPSLNALAVGVFGWRKASATLTVAAAAVVAVCGGVVATRASDGHVLAVARLLRADALVAVMLLVIGSVATLAAWTSAGQLTARLHAGRLTSRAARQYGVLVNAFVATMVLAVEANNLGLIWVAIEATTVTTALLVGHNRTRRSLEATWKYVVICSVGIALAFLGTVLLQFASVHAGAGGDGLDLDRLASLAPALDPGTTKLAAALLLLGFGAKVGLVPFHTWLADAHSQAPSWISALMSGVLLSVAFSALLRVKGVVDVALSPSFMRTGLLIVGLLTLAVAATLLVGQRDYKRMLAYSSLEHMGLIAVAAAAGTRLAVAALLLHVIGHGLAKAVLFLTAGELQVRVGSTSIGDVSGLLVRHKTLGLTFAGGLIALLGLPPFALFASHVAIFRGAADAGLLWPFAIVLLLVLVAFGALARHGVTMLVGSSAEAAPTESGVADAVDWRVTMPLVTGLAACLVLGVTAGPLTHVLQSAAAILGATT